MRNKLSDLGSSFARHGFCIEILNTHQQYIVNGEKSLFLKAYLCENRMDPESFDTVFTYLKSSGFLTDLFYILHGQYQHKADETKNTLHIEVVMIFR